MSKIILLGLGGSGGADTSEVTATRDKALESAITYFIVDDEAVLTNGTMKDFSTLSSRTLSNVTMSDEGVVSGTIAEGTSVLDTEEGYYTSDTTFTANVMGSEESKAKFGDAVASGVLVGQTFTSKNGMKIEGTMPIYDGGVE